MKINRLFLCNIIVIAVITIFLGSCSYHNDDNPIEYLNVEPEPEPEPEPEEPVDTKYTEAIYAPNSYMVVPGQSIAIPILKAYAIWNIYSNLLKDTDFSSAPPEPMVIWQDTPGLIQSVGLISINGEDSQMVVATSNTVGNAVVGIKIGGKMRWSWHIWVTPYQPKIEAYGKIYKYDNNNDGIIDYEWMDRNLGALSDGIKATETDSLAACGLMYQWGRKDPFPGDVRFRKTNETDVNYFDSKPIYNMQGVQLTEIGKDGGTGVKSIQTDAQEETSSLYRIIQNPTTLYDSNGSYNDWFVSAGVSKCDTLWNETKGKTPFDPCPEGWRIPAMKSDRSPWEGLKNITTQFSSLGVFPYAGFRYMTVGGCLKNSGWQTSLWIANITIGYNGSTIGNAYIMGANYNTRGGVEIRAKDISPRSYANSVRCVKE